VAQIARVADADGPRLRLALAGPGDVVPVPGDRADVEHVARAEAHGVEQDGRPEPRLARAVERRAADDHLLRLEPLAPAGRVQQLELGARQPEVVPDLRIDVE